jgi:SAM-dependent methyltransferase
MNSPQDDSTVSNFALCHGCGIVYATRRPVGERHRALMDDFPTTIGRDPAAAAANGLLNPFPLSDEDRARYRRMIAGGIFVSDHERRREHLSQVFRDRLENASHVELLGSLLDVHGARALEIRSRAGTIAHGLQRLYGATVSVMPIFESQRLIVEELYGIECSDLIDYDQFRIPFQGTFDLIVANHMLTHIVRLDRFFSELRAHLRPGGHLYLYNELDEAFVFSSGKSIVNSLNPVHLQTFDRASLMRPAQGQRVRGDVHQAAERVIALSRQVHGRSRAVAAERGRARYANRRLCAGTSLRHSASARTGARPIRRQVGPGRGDWRGGRYRAVRRKRGPSHRQE